MVPERAAIISRETELDERHGLARQQSLDRTASVRIVPPMARVSAEEAAEQLNRRLARKSAAKKGDGRTYNLLSEEGRAQFYRTAEFKEIGLTEEEADGLITAYAGRAGTSAVRVLLIDALLFGKAVRRAKRDRRNVPPEETMAAATAQEASGLTYSLLPEEERKGLHRTETSRSTGISAEEAAEQLNRRLAARPTAKKSGGRTYNLLSKENGYGGDALWENTANVYNTVVEKVSSNYTVKLDDNGYDINTVKQQIEKGNPVTMSINFKLGGHIVVVIGYTQNGFIVHDPYGNLNKGQNDDYGLDTDGAYVEYPYNKWAIGKKWIRHLNRRN